MLKISIPVLLAPICLACHMPNKYNGYQKNPKIPLQNKEDALPSIWKHNPFMDLENWTGLFHPHNQDKKPLSIFQAAPESMSLSFVNQDPSHIVDMVFSMAQSLLEREECPLQEGLHNDFTVGNPQCLQKFIQPESSEDTELKIHNAQVYIQTNPSQWPDRRPAHVRARVTEDWFWSPTPPAEEKLNTEERENADKLKEKDTVKTQDLILVLTQSVGLYSTTDKTDSNRSVYFSLGNPQYQIPFTWYRKFSKQGNGEELGLQGPLTAISLLGHGPAHGPVPFTDFHSFFEAKTLYGHWTEFFFNDFGIHITRQGEDARSIRFTGSYTIGEHDGENHYIFEGLNTECPLTPESISAALQDAHGEEKKQTVGPFLFQKLCHKGKNFIEYMEKQ